MKAYLFQNNREPYFWTKDEIVQVENNNVFALSKHKTFDINGVHFTLKNNTPQNLEFQNDGINIIILNYSRNINLFKSIFNAHKDKKFLFVIKTIEDYGFVISESQLDEFIEYVINSDNIKVIWDISEIKYKNFYFEPKVHLQNYYNNDNHFPSDLFLYGNQYLLNEPNKKRVGIHFNKGNLILRKKIIDKLETNKNDNLFFTINSDCIYNQINNINTNYKSNIFDNSYEEYGFPYTKYIDGFINFNTKSEMEVVYETFTSTANSLNLLKLNEKTFKHIYLGKPFIHTDPVAHKLLVKNGFSPYDSLYTKELLELYENTNSEELLKEKDYYWLNGLIGNINWLLDMDSTEWGNRITKAYEISKKNREKAIDLIFNKSLINYVINYDSL